MTVSPGDSLENGWTVGYRALWHERRNIQIKLEEGLNETLLDDIGQKFCKSIYYEFERSASKRIWIPCFLSSEEFESYYKGVRYKRYYADMYCIPRDISDRIFRNQYADIFGRHPRKATVEQFWSDIRTAVDIFLQFERDLYERSVHDPRPPRYILFEWGSDVSNWLEDFPKIALSALKLIREARAS